MLPVVAKPRILRYGGFSGSGDFYHNLDKRTAQKAPYNLPTAYTADRRYVQKQLLTGGYSSQPAEGEANSTVYYNDATLLAHANNRARSKLMSNLHDEAMWFVNFYERKQALSIFTTKALQLAAFAKWIRRGNVYKAEEALGIRSEANRLRALREAGFTFDPRSGRRVPKLPPKNRERWRGPKAISNEWLQYHFGLEPLCKDLYSTFDAFTDLPPIGRVYGSAGARTLVKTRTTYSSTVHRDNVIDVSYRSRTGCNVQIPDRDAYLANRMGLVNPLVWVYELTPWSFVWDWFHSLGDYINSMNDLYGVRVSNPWSSYTQLQNTRYTRVQTVPPYSGYDIVRTDRYFSRSTSLLSVKLAFKPFKGLSVVRAVTAISLLVQQLPSRGR